MVRQEWLFGTLCDNGEFNRPRNSDFRVAEGIAFCGELRAAANAMKARGFQPASPDRGCTLFTDGRSSFRLVEGFHCGACGRTDTHYTLRQVWGVA